MSTFIDLLPQALDADIAKVVQVAPSPQETTTARALDLDLESFAEDQIHSLVRTVFLSGPKPCRQVVFSAVDRQTDISRLCQRTAEALSLETIGATCWVGAALSDRKSDSNEQNQLPIISDQNRFGRLRDCSLQLSSNLWHMSAELFRGDQKISTAWLNARLAELRLEFEYLVIQAPAAAVTNEASLLARYCQGMVLVIEANRTRRTSAFKVKQMLLSSHVRLLGTVLTERVFPIPNAIYQRV
jgi:hypothetical protein